MIRLRRRFWRFSSSVSSDDTKKSTGKYRKYITNRTFTQPSFAIYALSGYISFFFLVLFFLVITLCGLLSVCVCVCVCKMSFGCLQQVDCSLENNNYICNCCVRESEAKKKNKRFIKGFSIKIKLY